MTATKNVNTAAIEAYISAQSMVNELANKILDLASDHQDNVNPDDVNWGHVGDLTHVTEKLAELVEHLS